MAILPKTFSENMIAGAGKISNMYRPFLLISFALDFQIWGKNPFGYHLTSLAIHTINGLLLFQLTLLLFKKRLMAFITSLIFIVHPVQTEAVSYASGRTDLLLAFFILTGLISWLLFIRDKRNMTVKYALIMISFVLALLSKETAIIFPLLLILLMIHEIKQFNKVTFNKLLSNLAPFFIISFLYILLRLTMLNFSNTLNFYTNSTAYSRSFLIRLLTFSRIFFEYLKILFFPKDLIFARNISYITNPFSPWVVAFCLVIGLSIVSIYKLKKNNKVLFFSFFWFFITILPVSGIIPINNIIAEHYLYFPAISLFLLTSFVLSYFINKEYILIKLSAITVLIIIAFAFTTRTVIRNYDWKDPVTFYTRSLAQSPWHIPMRHNLAMAYSNRGQYETAISEFKYLIKHADIYPNTHHNLANIYKKIGDFKKAEQEYLTALSMDPNFYFSYFGLADLYKLTGENEKLEKINTKIEKLTKSQ